jgi:hypothetical protein
MDPNACFARLLQSVADGDVDGAGESFDNLREWIGKGGFPPDDVQSLASDLSDCLLGAADGADEGEEVFLDFRIYLTGSGHYRLNTGDPSYDPDHRGYCGAGSVSATDGDTDTVQAVLDCLDDCLDVFAQSV